MYWSWRKANINLMVVGASYMLLALPCLADSQVRIVRLSDVHGAVQIDRNVGQGYEKAFLNLPITQGVKLATGNDGRAQVEFEDGSALRLTPGTVVEFPQLSLRDSGAKASTIYLQEGKAYINFAATKDDQLTLVFAREKVTLTHPVHLRLEMGAAEAVLAVFKGEAEAQGSFGEVAVAANHTATFGLADQSRYDLAKGVADDPYDAWDKEQDQYQHTYAGNNIDSVHSPYAYGNSDLNYYGSFTNVQGYGPMWQPYFVGAGWNPFMNGAWAYNPGAGYGWVSGYPWGWTPYYSGAWIFLPAYGWMWQPGGVWGGLGAFPVIVNPPANFVSPHSPNIPAQRVVAVNLGPQPAQVESSGKVTITNNSAGLGIPRGGIRNPVQISQAVQQHGFAAATVHVSSPSAPGWRAVSTSRPSSGFATGLAPTTSAGRSAWTNTTRTTSSSGHSSGGAHR